MVIYLKNYVFLCKRFDCVKWKDWRDGWISNDEIIIISMVTCLAKWKEL